MEKTKIPSAPIRKERCRCRTAKITAGSRIVRSPDPPMVLRGKSVAPCVLCPRKRGTQIVHQLIFLAVMDCSIWARTEIIEKVCIACHAGGLISILPLLITLLRVTTEPSYQVQTNNPTGQAQAQNTSVWNNAKVA